MKNKIFLAFLFMGLLTQMAFSQNENELRCFYQHGKFGFIDKNDKVIIPFKYDGAYSFSEGLVSVRLNEKWGFIDKAGKEVIPIKYDNAYSFSDGLAEVELNGEIFIINKKGERVTK